MTEPLARRLATALHVRADQLDDRNDTSPGWEGPQGRGRKAEKLRDFASHLSSDEAAPVLKDIADLEPIYGPLDDVWAVEIAETPDSARGPAYALSYLVRSDSPQAWLEFLRARYEACATEDGLGDR